MLLYFVTNLLERNYGMNVLRNVPIGFRNYFNYVLNPFSRSVWMPSCDSVKHGFICVRFLKNETPIVNVLAPQ